MGHRFESYKMKIKLHMLNGQNLLIIALLLPIFGSFVLLLFIPWDQEKRLRAVSLTFACLSHISYLSVWGLYKGSILKNSTYYYQFVTPLFWSPTLSKTIGLGIDGLSLFLILLITLAIPLSLLVTWISDESDQFYSSKEFLIGLLLFEFLVLIVLVFIVMVGSVFS